MKKMMLLLWVCFCFYLPTVAAETYQNRDYNFQMEIPDGWILKEVMSDKKTKEDFFILRSGTKSGEGQNVRFFGFEMKVVPSVNFPSGATFADATREQRKDMLDYWVQAAKDSSNSNRVTYSDFIQIGGHTAVLIKIKSLNTTINRGIVAIILNRTDYFINYYVLDTTGKYEQQFFDMLKTLRPIIGNNGSGEWQEDIKYRRDIAEQDAIGALTRQPIKITK